jgi:uncharacterized membrane protein YhhN
MTRSWPWLAGAAVSGVLAIVASQDGHWMLLALAKPLTTILLIALAWQRAGVGRRRSAILAGLVLSLFGDIALLWPQQGFLPGLVAFLLAHLAYLVAFTTHTRFASRLLPFAIYALLAALALSVLWSGVPEALRVPVIAYVVCLASMAAQAACAAMAEGGLARRAAIGGAFFMLSDTLLAFNKFAAPFALAPLAVLSTYWVAQAFIATSLPPRR